MIDKRVVILIALLVILDAFSTYLCTLYYPVELEANVILRDLLKTHGKVALVLYAPLEFTLLTLLLTAYSKILMRLGVKNMFKYCVIVLIVLYVVIALNLVGVLVKFL